jgi:pimeloyl-ACP methyl ester carboxylesterase
MTTDTLSLEKSTTVRSTIAEDWRTRANALREDASRNALRLFAALWPKLAHVHAADRFGKPARLARSEAPAVELEARRTWLAFGEQSLAVYEWGSSFGPTVLLAHGWSGAASQLHAFVAPLVARGHHVLAFDQPGHGESSGRYATLLDFARATEAVAKAYGPVDAVIAHSLGATGAALALSRGLRAERVVLIAPPGRVQPFALGFARKLGLNEPHALGMLAELERRLGGDLRAFELSRLAPHMNAKLLLLHDAADREVPFEQSAELAAAWPQARFEALSGLGHRRPLRDPRVIELALDFVAETQARAETPESQPMRQPSAAAGELRACG